MEEIDENINKERNIERNKALIETSSQYANRIPLIRTYQGPLPKCNHQKLKYTSYKPRVLTNLSISNTNSNQDE